MESVLAEYSFRYFNTARPHQGLAQRIPVTSWAWMAHGALSRRLLHLRCIAPRKMGPESRKALALVERSQRECAA